MIPTHPVVFLRRRFLFITHNTGPVLELSRFENAVRPHYPYFAKLE